MACILHENQTQGSPTFHYIYHSQSVGVQTAFSDDILYYASFLSRCCCHPPPIYTHNKQTKVFHTYAALYDTHAAAKKQWPPITATTGSCPAHLLYYYFRPLDWGDMSGCQERDLLSLIGSIQFLFTICYTLLAFVLLRMPSLSFTHILEVEKIPQVHSIIFIIDTFGHHDFNKTPCNSDVLWISSFYYYLSHAINSLNVHLIHIYFLFLTPLSISSSTGKLHRTPIYQHLTHLDSIPRPKGSIFHP